MKESNLYFFFVRSPKNIFLLCCRIMYAVRWNMLTITAVEVKNVDSGPTSLDLKPWLLSFSSYMTLGKLLNPLGPGLPFVKRGSWWYPFHRVAARIIWEEDCNLLRVMLDTNSSMCIWILFIPWNPHLNLVSLLGFPSQEMESCSTQALRPDGYGAPRPTPRSFL